MDRMLVHMNGLRIFIALKILWIFLFSCNVFAGQGREAEHQVPYCNSRFGFGVQQMHGGPVWQGRCSLI
jgi:hypothetical protein